MDDATSLPEMLRQTGWLRLTSAMVEQEMWQTQLLQPVMNEGGKTPMRQEET
jgi:hypothetical protein